MISKFKGLLSKGVQRSLIVGTLFASPLIGGLIEAIKEGEIDKEWFLWYSFFIGLPIYLVCVFLGLWIYDGFKQGND